MVKSNSLRTRVTRKAKAAYKHTFERGAKITVPCSNPQCKKEITRLASQAKANNMFCSRACWYTYRLGKPTKRRSISPEDTPFHIADQHYAELYIKQSGKCIICERLSKRLAIDHDHKTGKVRGLLCNNCNVALGMFGDSLPNLERAFNYLKSHQPTLND